MGLKKRLRFLIVANSLVGAAVAVSLVFSWFEIKKSLVRLDYAEKIDIQISQLQQEMFSHEISPINTNNLWVRAHKNLSEQLTKAPLLSPEELTIQRSIVAQTQGLLILYQQLQRLSNDQSKIAVVSLLSDRFKVQTSTVLEDTHLLSEYARVDIRKTLQRQAIVVMLILGFGFCLIFVGAHRLEVLLSKILKNLQRGISNVKRGQYQSVELMQGAEEFCDFVDEFNQMSQQLQKTTVSRDVLQKIVEERTAVLREIANTDPLTQVANRRALFERGEMEFNRAIRHESSYAILMIDCDWFKSINDNFGHPVGDNLLVHLCRICEKHIRDEDLLGRYGGEEFVILLPHCDTKGAIDKAQLIRSAVEKNALFKDERKIAFTISIGVASLKFKQSSFEQMLSDADKALLKAKQNGRNCVELA